MTQAELAGIARVPRHDVQRVEAGLAGLVVLERLRRMFEAAGGGGRLSIWWHGAAADRLIDERHAGLVERAVATFVRRGWKAAVEVSFSEFGERGSIDILAAHERLRAVAICEVKSDVGALEQMNRVLDSKERLAPKIAEREFGWRPLIVGRLLILADDSANRRLVNRHEKTMAAIYPGRGREVRAWLRSPERPLRGIWFCQMLPGEAAFLPDPAERAQLLPSGAAGGR
jgi:hypothetical protein